MGILKLVQRGRAVRLKAREGTFSYYHPDHLFTGLGWDAETASLLLVKGTVRSILVLGLGGGTVARQCRALFPDALIIGVEINKNVLSHAYRHFALGSVNVKAIAIPGQAYLRRTRRKFDAIIDDMWPLEPFSPKPALVEPDWPSQIRSHLEPDGMYALNLYSRKENPKEIATAVRRLRPLFPALREVRPGPGETTVIASGFNLRSARQAGARVKDLPGRFAHDLSHVKFITL